MKYFAHIFIILFISLAVFSCTEKIDIKLDESYARLVVDGSITSDTMAQTIRLSSTSSYYYNQPAPMVSGAKVTITDGTQTFPLSEKTPGIYQTASSVFGIPGKTYQLNISLAKPIGGYADYFATSTMYPVRQLDSISLLYHPEWSKEGIWEVKCYVQEPPTVDFYRFLILRNHTMLTDSLDEWFVTDDVFFNGNYTNGATVAYLQQGASQESLSPGDDVTVEVNGIGKDYYDFVMEAQAELRGSNPLFSGPPANVKGNISNGAVGSFNAYSATRSSTKVPVFK